MKCPKDGTELQPVEVHGVAIEKCHTCDGMWFDYGEVKQLQRAASGKVEEAVEEKYGNPSVTAGAVDRHMPCPQCPQGRLQRYHYTYARPILVDRCRECSGLWLDKGELDHILEEVAALAEVESEDGLTGFFAKFNRLLGG